MGRRTEFEPARAEAVLPAERLEKFREELERMYPKLPYLCRLYIPHNTPSFEDAVRELVQETSTRAWQSLNTYNGKSGMMAWLNMIAQNAAKDMFRRKNTKSYPDRNHSNAVPLDDTNLIDSRSSSPEERLDKKRNEALVEEALSRFKPMHRVIWRRKRDGDSIEEIALETGMKGSTIKMILFRMRGVLPGIIRRLRLQQARKRKNHDTEFYAGTS